MFHQSDRPFRASLNPNLFSSVAEPKRHILPGILSLGLSFFFLAIMFMWLGIAPSTVQARPLSGGMVNTCDEASFKAALAGGGTVTFNCSGTIVLTSTALITAPTTINGNGFNVTLSGGNAVRIITTTSSVGTLTVQNITLTNGIAVTSTGSDGGALYVRGVLVLSNTAIISNSATGRGGGAYITSTLTLTNAQFISNTAAGEGGGAVVFNVFNATTLNGGLFQNNTSATSGGGLYAYNTLILTGTQFIGNTANDMGGGAMAPNSATLNGGLFQDNVSLTSGGGLYVDNGLALTNTRFLNNKAQQGGGVHLNSSSSAGSVVNALFARNSALSLLGSALYLNSSNNTQILHTTIASPTPTLFNSGSAIYIATGTVGITNTIITTYSIGIERTAGMVYEDYNLFFGNTTNILGLVISSSNNVLSGTPMFNNPASDNYHLSAGSAAIDTGNNVGVTTDIDGDSRPMGGGYDIGYDESPLVNGPLSGVELSSPQTGTLSETIQFIANASPITASLPITYVWQATNQISITHSRMVAYTDLANFTWSITGSKVVTVTASNISGTVMATQVITINPIVSLSSASLNGPATASVSTTTSFSVTVSPITATLPINYIWQATSQTPITHSGIMAYVDLANFTWLTTGAKAVTVTVGNISGIVTTTKIITINAVPLSSVNISGPATTSVSTTASFSATVSPITATLPITYLWQATNQAPFTHSGLLTYTDLANFIWSTTGSQVVTVTASNISGTVSATQVITINPIVLLSSATISGPATALVSTTVNLTVTASPITATTPFTYIWSIAGQSPVTHTSSLTITDSLSSTLGVTGTRFVIVTVSNVGGTISATTPITILANYLSGVVFNDLNGNSLQDSGETGLSNVIVTASGGSVYTTTTDSNGLYRFSDLISGNYTVIETDPAGYSSVTPNVSVVPIAVGSDVQVDFADQPAGLVSGSVFNDVNGNETQDTGEVGLANVLITLSNGSVYTTTTSSSGVYSFTGIVSGTYTVLETDPSGYASTSPNYRVVIVPAGGSASASFGDQLKGTVGGSVFNDSNGNGLQDPGEDGLANVLVSLIDGVTYTTTTDINGGYIFTSVLPGAYLVRETDPIGYVSVNANAQSVSVAAGGSATANFGDQPANRVSGLVYQDLNGNGVPDNGEPGLGGVTIALVAGTTYTTTTASDGTYVFNSVTSGAYLVRETDPIGFVSTSINQVMVSVATGNSASANFGDQPASTLLGQVFNDLDANGLYGQGESGMGGITITLSISGVLQASTHTTGDGSYAFSALTAGVYDVCASVPDGFVPSLPACRTITLVSGSGGAANFGLVSAGNVSGAVYIDQNGNGWRDGSEPGLGGVELELRQGGTVLTTTTSGNGTFAFNFVSAGSYQLCVTTPTGFAETTALCEHVLLQAGSSAAASFGFVEQGAIQGVVFNDINSNGLPDVAEAGLGGVVVQLLNSSGTLITSTITSGDGVYRFDALTPGRYTIKEINPTGFTSTSQDEVRAHLTTNGSEVINFGDQRLGTVSGVMYEDSNGNGTQDPGEPGIGGAVIVLSGTTGIFTTTTAADGTYTFYGVVGGDYTVLGTPPAGCFAFTPGLIHVSVTPNGSGHASFGQIRLATASGVVFYDINGDGLQENGEPGLGGVEVQIWRGNAKDITTTTNANGQYVFVNMLPGGFTMKEINPPGYVSTTPDEVFINMGNPRAATVNFGDWKAGLINGNVFADVNGNGLRDNGELGLGGVTIELTTLTGTLTTTTTGDGRYQFSIPPGNYLVTETDPDGYVSSTPNVRLVSVPIGGSAGADFGDMPTGLVTGIVFYDLNGNGVCDVGEQGISGVSIELNGPMILTTTTAGDGSFVFRNVITGTYSVIETDPPGYVSSTPNNRSISIAPGGSASVEFGDQAQGSIGGIVFDDRNGNGRQDADEVGLGGILITLSGGSTLTMTTSGNGVYQFTAVAPGAYAVSETDLPGYFSTTPNSYEVYVATGGSATANFGDRPGGLVSGAVFNDLNGNGVRDDGEAGIGGVTIQLISGAIYSTTTTIGDGSYQFSNVPPDTYVVIETDPAGYISLSPNSVDISVPSGAGASANFADQQTGTVSGEAWIDANGNGQRDLGESGLGGVTVQISGPTTRTISTAGDGSYLFTDVVSGTYFVQVSPVISMVNTTPDSQLVFVPGGGSAGAQFGFQYLGTVVGAVFNDFDGSSLRDAREIGIGGVTIQLVNSATYTLTTTTISDGSYQFSDVLPGPYTVIETDPANYVSTSSNNVDVSVPSGGAAVANFGDQQVGTISGLAWVDKNGNGQRDTGESGLGGVVVQISGPTTRSITTTADGSYLFTAVVPGTYLVQVSPVISMVNTTPDNQWVIVGSGGSASANFGFQRLAKIVGTVFNDLNANVRRDPIEPGIGGVTITLKNSAGVVTTATQTTGDGGFMFDNLVADRYLVCETDPPGFTSTTPNCVIVGIADGGSFSVNFGDVQPGTIRGLVFNDANGNSIYDRIESGLNGVTITLYRNGAVQGQIRTAVNGNFSFANLLPGTYTLVETDPPGFVSSTPNTVTVYLPPNGVVGVNFGDLVTNRIFGTVFWDVNGDGAQNAGETGLGSGVLIILRNTVSGATVNRYTDSTGHYEFTGVWPGSYCVEETDSPGWLSTTFNRICINVTTAGNLAVNFGDALPGTISGQVTTLVHSWAYLPWWARYYSWKNVPLRGVTIELWDSSHTNNLRSTTTAANGTYAFSNLLPGNYKVDMLTPPYGLKKWWHLGNTERLVSLPQNPVGNFYVTYDPCVVGVAYNDLNLNGIYDEGEPPLGGVHIYLKDSSGNIVRELDTDADGSYIFLDVDLGTYLVEAVPPTDWATVTENPVAIVLIDPDQGEDISFGLVPANGTGGSMLAPQKYRPFAPNSGMGTVQGLIVDVQGLGLSGLTVQFKDATGNLVGQATTIANGTYLADNIPAGTLTVIANVPPGYVSITPNLQTIVVQAGQSAVANFVDAPESIGIRGLSFSDVNGNGLHETDEAGLGDIQVQLQQNGSVMQTVTTTVNGEYAFALVTGTYQILATDPISYLSTSPNTVAGWGPAIINFGDRYAGIQSAINGRVYNDANGNGELDLSERPLGAARITLFTITGTLVQTATTTGDGQYQFANLSPAAYQVAIDPDDGFLATTPITLTIWSSSDSAAVANFGRRYVGTTSGYGTIVGRVFQDLNSDRQFTSDEPPVAGATVRVWSGTTLVTETTTLGNGAYLFDLATGNYDIELVVADGFTTTTRSRLPIALADGQVTSLAFGLHPLTTLSGMAFFDLNGDRQFNAIERGAGGLTVTLLAADSSPLSTTLTSVDGYYGFYPVVSGTYTVALTVPTGLIATTSATQLVTFTTKTPGAANFGVQVAGVLGGQVFYDANGDNVSDSKEAGLSGVSISVMGLTQTWVVTTSSSGYYQVSDLPTGVYTVTESDPIGFTSITNTVVVTVSSGGNGAANFGDRPIGTISGNVFYDINVNKVMGAGEPGFGGNTVQLQDMDSSSVITTTVLANGSYIFDNVPPGNYKVSVTEPAGYSATTAKQITLTLTSGGSLAAQALGSATTAKGLTAMQTASSSQAANFGLWDGSGPTAVQLVTFQASSDSSALILVWWLGVGLLLLSILTVWRNFFSQSIGHIVIKLRRNKR
jgi:protocatechuate 3,4-dioxygenase beta subunit